MRKFKDLKSGDLIFIMSFNRDARTVSYRKATCGGQIMGSFGGMDNRQIYFKEEDESETSVNSEESVKFRSMGSSSYVAYFADIESLEQFVKREIEETYSYRSQLESIYTKAWDSVPTKKEESKMEKKPSLVEEPQKYASIDYQRGDILFNQSFEESYIYDGGNKLYASDGYDMDADTVFKLRLASKTEKKEFLCSCRSSILSNDKSKSDLVIEVLKVCGYKWDKSLKDIFHESD